MLLEVMEEKRVGMAKQNMERLSALLDPRRKLLDDEQLENGFLALRRKAEEDLKAVIAQFEVQPPEPAAASAPASVHRVAALRNSARHVWQQPLALMSVVRSRLRLLPRPGAY